MNDTFTSPAARDATQEVRSLVADALLKCEPAKQLATADSIADDMPLGAGGLGVSSLVLLNVFVQLEERLGFRFDDAAVANARFTTVGELVRFVNETLQRQRSQRLGGD